MTATIMPPEMLKHLTPDFVAPVVGVLCAPKGPDVTGRLFELGAGFVSEIRWQRAKGKPSLVVRDRGTTLLTEWGWEIGAYFKPDETFTPSAVKAKWNQIGDFSQGSEYPVGMEGKDPMVSSMRKRTRTLVDPPSQALLKESQSVKSNPQSDPEVNFKGKTVIITGAGAGLGRAYALMYGKLGANVVVNDVSKEGAEKVVQEVKAAGGKAIAAPFSAEDGEAIVKAAVDAFGTVHVLIANAGILRDKSFQAMTAAEWDAVIAVHLKGTYKVREIVPLRLRASTDTAPCSAPKPSGPSSRTKSTDESSPPLLVLVSTATLVRPTTRPPSLPSSVLPRLWPSKVRDTTSRSMSSLLPPEPP